MSARRQSGKTWRCGQNDVLFFAGADTPAGSLTAVEICEFANSQLLQFRYYDDLLDDELASIYADMQPQRWYDWIVGRHYARAARHVHALFIDVTELTDRTENALKIIGDVYAARLFGLVGARLDLGRWKTNVSEKLKTLDDIYRFSVEQVSMSRGQFLSSSWGSPADTGGPRYFPALRNTRGVRNHRS